MIWTVRAKLRPTNLTDEALILYRQLHAESRAHAYDGDTARRMRIERILYRAYKRYMRRAVKEPATLQVTSIAARKHW